VILQSGSALSPGAMMYNPLPTTEALAARVNCSLSDEHDRSTLRLLHCLKQVPRRCFTGSRLADFNADGKK